jgi:hypothetical protein
MADGRRSSGHDVEAPAKAEDVRLVAVLQQAQNADGGWPYRAGTTSWTEPTVLSLLALGEKEAAARGYSWLRLAERPGGGWAPRPGVEEATWVTSLVALLPTGALGGERYAGALEWILRQTPEDSTFLYRLRQRLLGTGAGERNRGWPWFPGTAAWVTPTSLAILALRKAQRRDSSGEIRRRIETGQRFLISRMCADGGWNHGSSRALGYNGNSYAETTGTALAALAGVSNLERSLAAAERHWDTCRSAEGAAWLKLGLLAQGRKIQGWPSRITPRNLRDTALCVLADEAEKGQNALFA